MTLVSVKKYPPPVETLDTSAGGDGFYSGGKFKGVAKQCQESH